MTMCLLAYRPIILVYMQFQGVFKKSQAELSLTALV